MVKAYRVIEPIECEQHPIMMNSKNQIVEATGGDIMMNRKKSCGKKIEDSDVIVKDDSSMFDDENLQEDDEDVQEDDEGSNISSPMTNDSPPCEDEENPSATCPYDADEMNCRTCKTLSQSQRDAMENIKEIRDEPSLDDVRAKMGNRR